MRLELIGVDATGPAKAGLAELTAQTELLNKALEQTTKLQAGATPKSYYQTANALKSSNTAFKNALASTGQFHIQQVKVNDATDHYTKLLQKQNLGFKQVYGPQNAAMMKSIYTKQLAMQHMVQTMHTGMPGTGSATSTMAIPKATAKSWDDFRSRVGMTSHMMASSGAMAVKWGKDMQWTGRQLSVGLTLPLVAFGAAAGVMFNKADQQFTRIRKVYNTTANQFSADVEQQKAAQTELDQLRQDGMQTATKAAQDYGTKMEDTLSVQADLAATGQKGVALQKATTEVVKNAMLGEIDYQTTTKATIALQQQLHLSSKQLADTWAYMNSVENQTSLTMKDFATAIPIALGPIKQMGGDVHTLGTLLTGLVSRGVQVGKAANAIKATAQRLIRPSQQVQDEFNKITGKDIVQIGKQNKGNLLGMLQDIYDVTKNLSQYDKTKVFAGLFGSFQLSTMSAMVASMGDLKNGIGQVSVAQGIGEQSAKQWGQVQQGEIKQFQESISGKFKRAIATIRVQLAKMGEPFLSVATHIITVLASLFKGFNALPGVIKKLLMAPLVIGAIAGPVIMLIGLLANLRGMMMRGIGTFGIFATKFKIVTENEALLAASAKLAEKGMTREASAAQLLTANIEALTYALQQQAIAVHEASLGNVPMPVSLQHAMTTEQKGAYYGSQYSAMPIGERPRHPAGTIGPEGGAIGGQVMSKEAYVARETAATEAKMKEMTAESMVIGQNTEKTGRSMKLAGAAGAVMAAGFAVDMVTTNQTAHHIANWAVGLALVAPLLGAAASKAKVLTSFIFTGGAAAGELEAGVVGAEAAAAAMVLPVTLVVAAVAAVGVGAFLWWKHEKAITAEKEAQTRAIYDQKNLMADMLKIQLQAPKVPYLASPSDPTGKKGGATVQQISAGILKTDTGQQLVDKFNSSQSAEQTAILLKDYESILTAIGGSAQKAQRYVEGFYIAAGDDAVSANIKAQQFADQFGNLDKQGANRNIWGGLLTELTSADDKQITTIGQNMGVMLADAIGGAAKEHRNQALKPMADQFRAQWKTLMDNLNSDTITALDNINVTSANKLKEFLVNVRKVQAGQMTNKDLVASTGQTPGANPVAVDFQAAKVFSAYAKVQADSGGMSKKLLDTESLIVAQLKKDLNITTDITTMKQLQNTREYQIYTVTKKNAVETYRRLAAQQGLIGNMQSQYPADYAAGKKKLQNLILQNLALGKNVTWGDLMHGRFTHAADDAKKIKDNLDKIPRDISVNVKFTGSDIASAQQSAMSSTMTDMNSMLTSQMDSQAQASMDATAAAGQATMDRVAAAGQARLDRAQAAGEARTKALEASQAAASKAFDDRWNKRLDAVNHYYDAREARIDKAIKNEQKAEAIRQRIYDAEQARLDHLTESANQTIDFNVALQTGQLDEAAKLSNDINATATGWALSQGQANDASKSQKKQDKLSSTKDKLEKERQARLKALQKQQDDERAHLQKMQQMQQDALQKSIANNQKALQAQVDAHSKAMQAQVDANNTALAAQWDAKKANLQQQEQLFLSYVPKNKHDLDIWLKQMGGQYKGFGTGTLLPLSQTWGGYFETAFRSHLREAALKTESDKMWTKLGKNSAGQLLAGMGFPTVGGFKHFLATGELPSDFGQKQKKPSKPAAPTSTSGPHKPGIQNNTNGYHVGGRFGIDPGGRGGMSGALKSNEGYGLLKHGEWIMNEKASRKHHHILKAMNDGKFGTGGYAPSMVGLMSGIGNMLFASGVGKAFGNAIDTRTAQNAADAAAKAQRRASKHQKHGPTPVGAGYVPGPGGKHRPVSAAFGLTQGLHDTSTPFPGVDIGTPLNTPAFAVADGTITSSRAVTSGGSPGNGLYAIPYRSYGNVIQLKTDGGPEVLYAHLNKRAVNAGQRVAGGAQIGLTGNTGNSFGAHLHFGSSDGNPFQWLRRGGEVKRQGLAKVHENEIALTAPLSKDLKNTVQAFGELASNRKLQTNLANLMDPSKNIGRAFGRAGHGHGHEGACEIVNQYTIPMTVIEPGASVDDIARRVVHKIEHAENRKPTKRTNRR